MYFTIETQFLYQLSANKKLHVMIAPQLNYFLFNDDGFNGLGGRNTISNYTFDLTNTIKNHILRPSLAVGLQYDIAPKSRLGLFYSHSFTPIRKGTWEYVNTNGDRSSGDFEVDGHQIGVNFKIFPFKKK